MRAFENNEYKSILSFDQKRIFFLNNSQVFETECFPVNNIEIKKEFDMCTKHLQVKFIFNSTLINGYLTKELILRSDSYLSECKKDDIFVNIDNKFNIVIKNKKVILAGLKNETLSGIIKLNHENNTQNKFDTFEKMNSNYENVIKLNGLYSFILCFYFLVIFILIILLVILFNKTNKTFLIKLINEIIQKFFENHLIENIKQKNEEFLLNKEINQCPSAPPFELTNEPQINTNSSSPIKIYPNIEETVCQYCKRFFKNNRGLNVHLR